MEIAGKKTVTLTSRAIALFRDLFADLHTYADQGPKEFQTADYYDYFHTCLYPGDNVNNLVKVRELEIKAFENVDTALADIREKIKD